MRNRFSTPIRPDIWLISNSVGHILGNHPIPKRGPSRVVGDGVGPKCLIQIVTCKITGRYGQDDPSVRDVHPRSHPCQSEQRGHLVRSLFIKRKDSGLLGSSMKGRKGQSPRRWPSFSRGIAKPTFGVLLFGLAEQTAAPNCSQREWLSTTCCLCLSGEKRQEVGECHEYKKKTHSETILSRCSATAKKWAWDSSAKSLVDTMHVIITWSGLSSSNFCNKQFPYAIKGNLGRFYPCN